MWQGPGQETARVPPTLDSPQSAAPETFLSRDAVSAFPLKYEPLPQPLPDVRCPESAAHERWPWRFCVNPALPRAIEQVGEFRFGRPFTMSAAVTPFANPSACPEVPPRETKSRARPVQLHARNAQVRQNSVGRRQIQFAARLRRSFEKFACTSVTLFSNSFSRSRAISRACASRSNPINLPVVSRRAISTACPPSPTVASR